MSLSRRILILAILALPVAGTILRPALAEEPEVYAPSGLAIGGYDPVAYFTAKKPIQGAAEHALRWRGATWYFATAANMEAFEMNPAAYAPQYGGYCAYSVSRGSLSASSPEAFTIHGGRLYLTSSAAIRTVWGEDIEKNIRTADGNWLDLTGN
jgi:YHS domain-containing protein